jgi:ankyrin repeat protein
LLSKDLYVDVTDAKGSTPLHTSVIQMDYDCMRLLCEAKATINLKNDSYMSAIDIAESLRMPKLVNYLTQHDKNQVNRR